MHVNRLWQRDISRLAVFIMILCSILPCSLAVRANGGLNQVETMKVQGENTSVIDGKRLFFNQEQRRASTSNADVVPALMPSESITLKGDANVEPEKPIVVTGPTVHGEKIHYHARIEGLQVIRVIVNGLPCEAVNRSVLASGSSGIVLNCKSIIAKRFQLVLLADGASIQAMDGKRVKGIITPGDSL